MDINTVYQLFGATFHSDRSIQKQAELQLKQLEFQPGFVSVLLQILNSKDLENGTKQAVSIYLKNMVRHSWHNNVSHDDTFFSIAAQDKETFKLNILNILAISPNLVRIQLIDCLKKVLIAEYPLKWPSYMNQVRELLVINNPEVVYVGLVALQQVVNVYQWKSGEDREPLNEIIKNTFGIIIHIAQGLINETNLVAAEMLRIIIKTYNSSVYFDFPDILRENENFLPWFNLLINLTIKDIPNDIIPVDLEERQKFIWYRVKRWCFQTLNRIFSKFGNPIQIPSSSSSKYLKFSENFIKNYAPEVLQKYLEITERWIKKEIWLNNKILYFISDFYKDALTNKITWHIMKPYCLTLATQFIFPQLCFSDEDEQLWTDDPVEYIFKRVDPLDDFNSPMTSVTNFLIDLVKYRKKFIFSSVLEFANNVLINGNERPREKDGALKMVGTNLSTAFGGVINCIKDPELPVKVQACLALQILIKHKSVRNAIIPNIAVIMQEILDITNQIDSDILGSVMEDLVEEYSNELAPFAVQLCQQLCNTFLRIMQEYQESEAAEIDNNCDVDDFVDSYDISDKTIIASGVLKTVITLILSLESSTDLLHQLENVLLPIISFTLENNIIDLYSDIFDIIDSCTFSTKTISNTMWNLFNLIYKTFKLDGIDYIEEMLPSLDNYVLYGRDVFIQNKDLQMIFYDMIETIFNTDTMAESDKICGCKLAEVFILNCKGHIDQIVNCIYYNPLIILDLLEKKNFTQPFFNLWFENINQFKRVHDKKLVILTLCDLLEIPLNKLPLALQSNCSNLFDGILNIFKSLPKAEEYVKYLELLAKEHSNSEAEDGYDYDERFDEEVLLESPLDKIDVYVKFRQTFIEEERKQNVVRFFRAMEIFNHNQINDSQRLAVKKWEIEAFDKASSKEEYDQVIAEKLKVFTKNIQQLQQLRQQNSTSQQNILAVQYLQQQQKILAAAQLQSQPTLEQQTVQLQQAFKQQQAFNQFLQQTQQVPLGSSNQARRPQINQQQLLQYQQFVKIQQQRQQNSLLQQASIPRSQITAAEQLPIRPPPQLGHSSPQPNVHPQLEYVKIEALIKQKEDIQEMVNNAAAGSSGQKNNAATNTGNGNNGVGIDLKEILKRLKVPDNTE
ncbi:7840_t:CDS:10 [Entrophospora sp. SA101]|nr:7836_t:CDS:10 [Entrophospora sp. SA101]CAJ0906341.1 7840_t:CDS:10 [Entrophospora sp. SA101]